MVRWADTNGVPVCPSCGSVEAYEARRRNGALRFRCMGCKKNFTITSGTLFAITSCPCGAIWPAIAVFCNEVKGKSALALSCDLGLSYRPAFVLLHKLREAMAEEMRAALSAVKARRRKLMAATSATTSSPPTLRKVALTPPCQQSDRQAQGCRYHSRARRKFGPRRVRFGEPSRFIHPRSHRQGHGCECR
jgi:hypothetical protein